MGAAASCHCVAEGSALPPSALVDENTVLPDKRPSPITISKEADFEQSGSKVVSVKHRSVTRGAVSPKTKLSKRELRAKAKNRRSNEGAGDLGSPLGSQDGSGENTWTSVSPSSHSPSGNTAVDRTPASDYIDKAPAAALEVEAVQAEPPIDPTDASWPVFEWVSQSEVEQPLEPGTAAWAYLKGTLLEEAERYEEAAEEYRAAAALDQPLSEPRRRLCLLLEEQLDDFACAEAELREMLLFDPTDVELRAQLASCLMKQGELEPADREFTVALALEPENTELLERYGDFQLIQGQLVEATRAFEKVLSVDPKHAAKAKLISLYKGEDPYQ